MLIRSYKIVAPRRFESYIDDISLNDEEAIVKIDKVAICKADIRYYMGNRPPRLLGLKYPLNLIHEAIGTVCKELSNEFRVGDKVVLVPNIIPNSFDRENLKEYDTPELGENYCPDALFASSNYDGFSKEYINFPKRNLIKLPKGINENILVFSELTSIAYSAYRRSKVNKSDRIAIWGDGILGFIICSLLKAYGIKNVMVIGKHIEKLREFPTDLIYTVGDPKIKDMKFDIGYECVGGMCAKVAIDEIITSINIGGRIILTGVSEEKVLISTRKILEKGISIYGVTRSNIEDFRIALEFMGNEEYRNNIMKLILGEKIIRNVQDFQNAFELEINNSRLGKYILNYIF